MRPVPPTCDRRQSARARVRAPSLVSGFPSPLVFWASRGCVGVPPPWRVPVGDGLELLPPCGHRFVEAVKTGRYKHPRSSRAGVVRRGSSLAWPSAPGWAGSLNRVSTGGCAVFGLRSPREPLGGLDACAVEGPLSCRWAWFAWGGTVVLRQPGGWPTRFDRHWLLGFLGVAVLGVRSVVWGPFFGVPKDQHASFGSRGALNA